METEMDHEMMDHTMDETLMEEDMPVESTTGAPDEELMYTTGEGVEYQTAIDSIATTSDLSDAQVAGIYSMVGIWGALYLAILVVILVAHWKIFVKAGQAGWKSLIPFYNAYVLLQIVGRPGWWLLLFLVPFINIVIAVIVAIDLAKSFGRSEVFGIVALFLFSLVGYVMLAFGKDKYLGPGGTQAPATSVPEAAPPAAPAV